MRRAVLERSIYILKYGKIYYDATVIKTVIKCKVCEISHLEYDDLFP